MSYSAGHHASLHRCLLQAWFIYSLICSIPWLLSMSKKKFSYYRLSELWNISKNLVISRFLKDLIWLCLKSVSLLDLSGVSGRRSPLSTYAGSGWRHWSGVVISSQWRVSFDVAELGSYLLFLALRIFSSFPHLPVLWKLDLITNMYNNYFKEEVEEKAQGAYWLA